MHRSYPAVVLAVFLFSMSAVQAAQAHDRSGSLRCDDPVELKYMTEEYYPYNFSRNGTAAGISVDMLHAVWNVMGVPPQPIHIYPWARGYMLAQRDPGTVLFSTARTSEREHLFKWAGPIAEARFVLISRSSNDVQFKGMDDIRKYSVGTVRKDVTDMLMDRYRNVTRVEAAPDIYTNFRKLMLGRLDLIVYEESSFARLLEKMDYSPMQFDVVHVLKEATVYFAFHNSTGDELVARFQKAVDTVRKSTLYPAILNRYLE